MTDDLKLIDSALRGLIATHGEACHSEICIAVLDGNSARQALARLADIFTLRPASEWKEADGPVLWWKNLVGEWWLIEKGAFGHSMPVGMWYWSPIPKVETPEQR